MSLSMLIDIFRILARGIVTIVLLCHSRKKALHALDNVHIIFYCTEKYKMTSE